MARLYTPVVLSVFLSVSSIRFNAQKLEPSAIEAHTDFLQSGLTYNHPTILLILGMLNYIVCLILCFQAAVHPALWARKGVAGPTGAQGESLQ
ncbi:hypothetical protein ACI6Q2_06445 [Chitinophagaceae bacterium LWZ2-11]